LEPNDPPQIDDSATILTTIPSPAQRDLVERIATVLRADGRIVAAWLGGSLARGNADIYSDVDIHAIVDDGAFAAVLGDLDGLVDRVSSTVYRRRMVVGGDNVLVGITPEWHRFDLVVHPASVIANRTFAQVGLLFAREDPPVRPRRTAGNPAVTLDQVAQFAPTVQEFLRVLGLLPVVVGREEFLVGMDGVVWLRRFLIDLFLLANGITDRGGVLRLNPLLTDEQRTALDTISSFAPKREAVIAGHIACARLFLPLARSLFGRHGVTYPDAFERATLDHLNRALGVTLG
jgi:predicted nucleotidyltransferase